MDEKPFCHLDSSRCAQRLDEAGSETTENSMSNLNTSHTQGNAALETLPPELLFAIASELSSLDRLVLSYVSRRLSSILDLTAAKVHGPIPNLRRTKYLDSSQYRSSLEVRFARKLDRNRAKRLHLLCLLETNRPIIRRPVCSACVRTHDVTQFTPENLRLEAEKRKCIGSSGYVWICPHTILDHDFTKLNRAPVFWDSCLFCFHRSSIRTAVSPTSARIRIPIRFFSSLRDLYACDVSQLVWNKPIPVCPHIISKSNREVLRNFDPNCRWLEWGSISLSSFESCSCRVCMTKGRLCHLCSTFAHWRATKSSERVILFLIIKREFGHYRKITDPHWTSQLVQQEEFPKLEDQWSVMSSAFRKPAYEPFYSKW